MLSPRPSMQLSNCEAHMKGTTVKDAAFEIVEKVATTGVKKIFAVLMLLVALKMLLLDRK